MKMFLLNRLKQLKYKLSIFLLLGFTSIYAQQSVDVVLSTTLRIENIVNVPIITPNGQDNTIVLTHKEQYITDVFAKYTVYGLEQLYPDSSSGSLQELYKLSFRNRDLIKELSENVPDNVFSFGSSIVTESSIINQDIIDFFNNDETYRLSGYLSTSDLSHCYIENCDLIPVSEDFKFSVSVNYDAENELLVMQTTEVTSGGNTFVYKFKKVLNSDGFVLWDAYSSANYFMPVQNQDASAEVNFFNITHSLFNITFVIDSENNSFKLEVPNQIFGRDTVCFKVEEIPELEGVSATLINGGINLNVKTSFTNGAGYSNHSYMITDNIIDLSVCYLIDDTLTTTDLEDNFEIPLDDFGTYIVNINRNIISGESNCDNSRSYAFDSLWAEYISTEDYNFFADHDFVLESTIVNNVKIVPLQEYTLGYKELGDVNEFELDALRTCYFGDENQFTSSLGGETYHIFNNGYFKAYYNFNFGNHLPGPSCEIESFEFFNIFSISGDDYDSEVGFTKENYTKVNYIIDADREGFTLVSEAYPDNFLIFKIEDKLSVSELHVGNEIQIINDASAKTLKITASSLDILEVTIYNVLGKKVEEANKNFANISTANINSGVYIVSINTPQGKVTKRIVIR